MLKGGLSLLSRCGIMDIEENLTAIQKVDDDDDACSGKTIMTCDNGGDSKPWSDLTHDVLFLVMMQLGVIDFVAFRGVCKSWRSFAVCNLNTFMASRPPMFMSPDDADVVDWYCYLKDVEGRRFKTVLPHSAGALCVGITCGYAILYGTRAHDFWLVNLITRHELHFPNAPTSVIGHALVRKVKAILVFSPSLSGGSPWVFLVLNRNAHEIWFSSESGKWDHVSFTVPMEDLKFFKGKIYTLQGSTKRGCKTKAIGVMRLDPKESKLMLLETKKFPGATRLEFVCSGENLYVLQEEPSLYHFKPHILDFDKMEWVEVANENTHAFFLSYESHCGVVKPESWWQPQFRINTSDLCGNETFFDSDRMWYFPHEAPSINHMDE